MWLGLLAGVADGHGMPFHPEQPPSAAKPSDVADAIA